MSHVQRASYQEGASARARARTVVDLFSGVGGLSLGAARAGARVLAAVDNDDRVATTYKRNFPRHIHLSEDITVLSGARLLRQAEIAAVPIDGVIGGPPCQGFSCIGHRNPDDARNGLFVHFFRLVAELRPAFYVAENVGGILAPRYDKLRTEALSQLAGYIQLAPHLLRSSDYGVPTRRERVFFVGYRPERMCRPTEAFLSPSPETVPVTVGEALMGLPEEVPPSCESSGGWCRLATRPRGAFWRKVLADVPEGVGDPEALHRLRVYGEVSACVGTRHTADVEMRFAALKEGARDRTSRAVRLSRTSFSPTIRAGTGPERGSFQAVRPIHPTQPRVITPREAARLQGFPDWFVFDATKWHSFRQIGNSVSPILAEAIIARLLKCMPAKGETDGSADLG